MQGECDENTRRVLGLERILLADMTATIAEACELSYSQPHAREGGPILSHMGGTHDDVEADLTDQVLGGRFEIVRPIGRGGMGVVWLALDRHLGSQAAVKVPSSLRSSARRRFAEESELLGLVRDPHIVARLASGHTDAGVPFLAMEYIAGEDLGDRLATRGPIQWRDGLRIGIHIARALRALHRAGVVHRDVKPSNIMLLAASPEDPCAKLLDLGVARKIAARGARPGAVSELMTAAGHAAGTPGFQAPEAGHVEPDPRLDVYGLGATLYQLCTGRVPPGLLSRPSFGRGAPDALADVVCAALAPDPRARTSSIEHFLGDLEWVDRSCCSQ